MRGKSSQRIQLPLVVDYSFGLLTERIKELRGKKAARLFVSTTLFSTSQVSFRGRGSSPDYNDGGVGSVRVLLSDV